MKKITIAFFFFLSWGIALSAQPKEAIFAYARKSWAKYQPQTIDGYKYEVTQQVYDQLIKARGDLGGMVPALVMNNGTSLIAWMDPAKLQIGIEEKAYDVCTSFGADSLNALAALLAHEVTHYYEKHDWARQFAQQNESLATAESLGMLADKLKQETQADHIGGLLAFSAGFNTYEVIAPFLEKAYAAYGFPDQLPGYPPLAERIQMAENTAQHLAELQSVWETANLLSIVEEYALAKNYYQHILKDYQGYEVFNNAGVNATLSALQLFEPEEWPYALPLERDGESRLDQLKERLPKDRVALREKYLNEAARFFESAENISKDYPPALLNQACIYALQGQWDDAEFWANKARKLSRQQKQAKGKADAEVLLGILAAMQSDTSAAVDWFEEAKAGNPSLAKFNLGMLQQSTAMPPVTHDYAKGVERIEHLDLDDFLAAPAIDHTIGLSESVFCGVKQLTASKLLLHYADEGAAYALFQRTAPAYKGQTLKGIQLGASRDKIIDVYGLPSSDLQMKRGSCLHYKSQQIFFELNEKGVLLHWVVYQMKVD
ncbi:MAG: hypothetical protein R2828_07960 [Saprospiraceae bacterium]